MMVKYLLALRSRIAQVVLAAVASSMLVAGNALAAPDPTTGIDYSQVATDTLGSAKPAVVAGVVILTLVTAVTLGKRLWNKVSH